MVSAAAPPGRNPKEERTRDAPPLADDARGIVIVSVRGPAADRVRNGRIHASARGGLSAALALAVHNARSSFLSVHDLDSRELCGRLGVFDELANRALWPILHGMPTHATLIDLDFAAWVASTRAIAQHTLAILGDRIAWVHDYQLALLPGALRSMRQDAPIGWFCHVPWPSSDMFAILPNREAVLDGILGASYIGFHTARYLDNFMACVRDLTDHSVDTANGTVLVGNRTVHAGVHPVGVPFDAFDAGAQESDTLRVARELRTSIHSPIVIAAIDRLDYTKGIVQRLDAFRAVLERRPDLRERVSFVQVGIPTREAIPGYAELRREVEARVEAINRTFAKPGWMPVRYWSYPLSGRDLLGVYLAADIMAVTPLRDGMNLVAQEFVATRHDGRGVLVLSEFAGAAQYLRSALLVNPWWVEHLAEALITAIEMPVEEKRARMEKLREEVRAIDLHGWSRAFVRGLES